MRAQVSSGSPPFIRPASALNASCVAFNSRVRDGEQAIDRHRQPFFQAELLLESVVSEAEGGARFRRDFVLEVLDVGSDRLRGFGLRVGEVAEQVKIVDVLERSRQLVLDELQRAAHRLDADLDEDAWRILDVVAGRLDQARRLPQLRQHAAGALGCRRVGEQRLAGQARRQEVRVELRDSFPRAHGLQFEHPRLQIRRQHAMLEALERRQRVLVDFVQPAQVTGQRVGFGFDRLPAHVLQEVVVRMHAVQRGVGRDASRGGNRAGRRRNEAGARKQSSFQNRTAGADAIDPPMVQ